MSHNQFTSALLNPGREMEGEDCPFDWLIGGWALEIRDLDPDGELRKGRGEWWFSKVLEGRAVQDVLICPPPGERAGHSEPDHANNRYGSTFRWFDPVAGLWRCIWINPVSGITTKLVLQKNTGTDLVLLTDPGDQQLRWSFDTIRPDSFRWRGEIREKGGEWRLQTEFLLRRIM